MSKSRGPCVISGGARGIGLEMARILASQGHSLALCSRSEDQLATAKKSLSDEFGVKVVVMALDVTDELAVKSFAKNVEAELGSADVLINNAAVLGPVGRVDQIDISDAGYALSVNVIGILNMCAAFVPQMLASGGGRILNMSGGGVGGSGTFANISTYTSSKFATVGLTEVLARELASENIQVNAIAPGAQPTEFVKEIMKAGPEVAGEALYADTSKNQSKEMTTDKLAALLTFLVAPETNWITGKTLSAQWDDPAMLESYKGEIVKSSMFNLRRIDNELFGELKKAKP